MLKQQQAIGVDLGGTKIEIGLVDAKGTILNSIRLDTDNEGGPAGVQNQIIRSVRELSGNSAVQLGGIGVGVAGQVDSKTGLVYFAPNLPNWHNIPLKKNLEESLKMPVKIINDVRAITWGEWLFGAGKNVENIACVFVGTGIGGGVVCEGRLLTGFSNTFGEVGHMTIELNGPVCTCGKRGCWESIAGGWGIAKHAREMIMKDRRQGETILNLAHDVPENISAKIVIDAYHMHDPLARHILEKVKEALIAGCSSLVNLYNPQLFILGGGILEGLPEFIPVIAQGVKKSALKAATQDFEVVAARLGKRVGVIGAAAAVLSDSHL